METIKCNVPQESSLGWLLFLMYVNGLPKLIHFDTTFFANDIYLSLFSNSLLDLKVKSTGTWLKSTNGFVPKNYLETKKKRYALDPRFFVLSGAGTCPDNTNVQVFM